MPVFNLTLPRAVKALLERNSPAETLKPGDVLMTNDPWLCAGHLFDIAVVTPASGTGARRRWLGTVGHVSDIGGTKDSLRAREIYEEGFQIPPMKLSRRACPTRPAARFDENVRNGEQVLGDLHSFVAANALGARAASRLHGRLRHARSARAGAVVQGRSEAAMRAAIRRCRTASTESEIWNNPLGEPLRYPVKLTVKGDGNRGRFRGRAAATAAGRLNCTMNYTAAHATYPLKCMLTPNVRGNAGCYRPFSVSAPEGSILNPASRPR
jgi:5-oxoprolinase (ATP-hydrolysing)